MIPFTFLIKLKLIRTKYLPDNQNILGKLNSRINNQLYSQAD